MLRVCSALGSAWLGTRARAEPCGPWLWWNQKLLKLAQSFAVSYQELPSLPAQPWGYRSCLGICRACGGDLGGTSTAVLEMAPWQRLPACSHLLPVLNWSHGKMSGLIYNGGSKVVIPFSSLLHPISAELVCTIFVWLEFLKLKTTATTTTKSYAVNFIYF